MSVPAPHPRRRAAQTTCNKCKPVFDLLEGEFEQILR